MFFLRSAFWLTVMFVIMAPKDIDLGRQVDEASRQAVSIGRDAVIQHVLSDCMSFDCALLSTSGQRNAATPDAHPADAIPLPRPRPDRLS